MYLFLIVLVLYSPLGSSETTLDINGVDFEELDPNNVPSELVFTTSTKHPDQLCVYNQSSKSAVIFDTNGGKCGIIDGIAQRGIIMDQEMGVGVEVNRDCYNFDSLEDNVMNSDLDKILEDNAPSSFSVNKEWSSSMVTLVKKLITAFSPHFLIDIMKLGAHLGVAIFKMIRLITTPIKKTLHAILDMTVKGWKVFKGGFRALLNIFKWMGILSENVLGGVGVLVIHGIKFGLDVIFAAIDGAKAFYVILNAISKRINVMQILGNILKSSVKIVKFIIGLGGQVVRGISGLFIMIQQLFTIKVSLLDIVEFITKFITYVIKFIMQKSVSRADVDEFTEQMLVVPRDSQKLYGTTNEYNEYSDFFLGLTNKKQFKIENLNLGTFVDIVVSSGRSGTNLMGDFMSFFKPVVPVDSVMPSMFKSMVKSLKDEKGRDHVRKVFNNITIPEKGPVISGYGKTRTTEPTVDELQRVPIIKDMYKTFDELSMEKTGTSFRTLLTKEHISEVFDDIADICR